jgi:hypothetical protein
LVSVEIFHLKTNSGMLLFALQEIDP